MGALRWVTALTALVALVATVEVLRRRQLREKYAALWLVVAAGIVVLGLWPQLLDRVARVLGVADPPNLLAFAALLLLLGVCAHLSWEASRLEEETRDLAEELALLRHEVEQLRAGRGGAGGTTPPRARAAPRAGR